MREGRLVARAARFERATSWFEARHSIQLSYARVEDYRRRRAEMVWAAGFEPATFRFQTGNSDQAELRPEGEGRGRSVFMARSLARRSLAPTSKWNVVA